MRVSRTVDVEHNDGITSDLSKAAGHCVALALAGLVDDFGAGQCLAGGFSRTVGGVTVHDDDFVEVHQVGQDLPNVRGFVQTRYDHTDARILWSTLIARTASVNDWLPVGAGQDQPVGTDHQWPTVIVSRHRVGTGGLRFTDRRGVMFRRREIPCAPRTAVVAHLVPSSRVQPRLVRADGLLNSHNLRTQF